MIGLDEKALRHVRGRDIGMIFQEPMTALDPVFRVGRQIAQAVRAHEAVSRQERQSSSSEPLEPSVPALSCWRWPWEPAASSLQAATPQL